MEKPMKGENLEGRRLLQLYYRYVGEPERMRDVYGYWLFLIGSLGGLAAIVTYLVEQALFPGDLAIREVAIITGAAGLTIGLLGIVVLLPVRRNGIFASIGGAIIAFGGIGLFWWAYPHAWYVSPDYSAEIIAVYGTGITIIAAVAVLVPIITGEKGLLVEPELGISSDQPPILLGKATRDAFYGIYETPTNEWTWRMIHRNAIAESERSVRSDTDARLLVEEVRDTIGAAGLLDLTTASFRLYQTDEDEWRWSLVRQDGSVVAISADTAPSRDEVESTVTFLSDHLPSADTLEIHGAAFDVYQDDADRWQWRLVDEHRRPLARSAEGMQTEASATTSMNEFVERVGDARVIALDDVGFELFETEDGWGWRGVASTDEPLVTGMETRSNRQAAETATREAAAQIAQAPIVEYGSPGFELVPQNGGWTWRLRDETDEVVAAHAGDTVDRSTAHALAERTREALPDATIIDYEDIDFESYPVEGEWRWRLVSEDRDLLAQSVERFPDETTATEAAENVKACMLAAELIEFEQAAFQQYELDGEWRWRLIDDDGQVLADSGEEYGSKEAVREGMTTLKEHAPDAEVLEIETAAFEIYRGDDSDYGWRLIDEGGTLIAEGATAHPSRSAARDAVSSLTDHVAATEVRPMEQAAFQLSESGDRWTGRLIDIDGTILAQTRNTATTRDAARQTIEGVRTAGASATIDTLGEISVKLRNGAGWRWELMEADGTKFAAGERTYESRDTAIADIQALIEQAENAPVFTIDGGIVWANAESADGDWHWQLVDGDRTILGAAPRSYESRDDVREAVDVIKTRAPDATQFEIETIAFEIVLEDGSWYWRTIDENETILAVDPGDHTNRQDVSSAIERARSAAKDASILKIDDPVFEFHEREDGWVWRLLDATGEPVAESIESHPSRQDAREEMLTAKEFGPGGDAVVTW